MKQRIVENLFFYADIVSSINNIIQLVLTVLLPILKFAKSFLICVKGLVHCRWALQEKHSFHIFFFHARCGFLLINICLMSLYECSLSLILLRKSNEDICITALFHLGKEELMKNLTYQYSQWGEPFLYLTLQ